MVRIKDVAEAVGVSTATVSNVINGKDQRVSGEVRERIQKALDEMGYVRNRSAMMLAQTNSNMIGVLFAAGMLFSFKLVLPVAMSFFLGMGNTDFQPFLSAGSYFDFILTFVLPFGMLFEMPLVMLVLAWMGIVTSDMLAAKFRVVIVVCFVIGALFTPLDV